MESASGGKQHVGYSVTFQNSLVGQQCFLTAIGFFTGKKKHKLIQIT